MENKRKFNVFRNFGLIENQHSKLLKKLLHPNGRHLQGTLFLSQFLSLIGIRGISEDDMKRASVELEVNSGVRGRIDMLVTVGNMRIIVESKVRNANFADNQLYRYWKNDIYKHYCREQNLDYKSQEAYNQYEKEKDSLNYKLVLLLKDKKDSSAIKKASVKHPAYKYIICLPKEMPISPVIINYKKDIKSILINCLTEGFKTGDAENNARTIDVINQYIEYIESNEFGDN